MWFISARGKESGNEEPTMKHFLILSIPEGPMTANAVPDKIRFNIEFNKTVNKTRRAELYKRLRPLICSEPLHSAVYSVPKNHNKEDLKCRPIHSATDTPSSPF